MKIITVVTRLLIGLLYTVSAVGYFLDFMPQPELEGPSAQFIMGLSATGYFIPFLKSIELICGLSLVTGKFVAVATIIIFPVTVNIFLYHAFLAPEGMIIPVLMMLANVFLAYAYWDRYKPIWQV